MRLSKTWYAWTDRTGITNPDVTGPYQLANLTPVSTADAGTLVITADGTASRWRSASPSCSGTNAATRSRSTLNDHTQRVVQERGRELHCGEWIWCHSPGFLAVDVSLAAGYTVLVQSIIPSGSVNLHTKLF